MALLEGCKHEVELTVPLLTIADETDKAVADSAAVSERDPARRDGSGDSEGVP